LLVESRRSRHRVDTELHGHRHFDHGAHLRSVRAMNVLLHVVLGALFGLLLSRSGAADYGYIQAMFRFESFQLYGIIGTAVAVTAPGLWLLRRWGRTLSGGSPLV